MSEKEPDLFDWRPPKKRSRADQVINAFEKFNEHHPDVWPLFKRFSLEVIKAGHKHYAAAAIFERIRWHMEIENRGGSLKLNNNFKPYYARMFHLSHPEHAEFFRNRKLTSQNTPAYKDDVQEFNSGKPEDEEMVSARLSELLSNKVSAT